VEESEIGLKDLSDDEQLALAALLRLLVRLDGEFSESEQEALEEIALDFGEKRFWKVMEDAASKASDEDGIKRVAQAVVRTPARELIYSLLVDVAQSDVIQGRESWLLEWLRTEWKIDEVATPYRG
jgi:uncharacterized tellurite resistance protein B-like protein